MDRRSFLRSAAGFGLGIAALTPEQVMAAGAGQAGWRLGFADVMADLGRAPMRLVQGKAPGGLSGSLYRNGPARFRRPGGDAGHWFDGDGLVRAFRLDGAGGATLEARFVDTPKRRVDEAAKAVVTPGFGTAARPGAVVADNDSANGANISVMPVGGELWALWEAGSPVALDPATLATKGLKTLRPDLAHMPFLAHPRREPNGRVWNLGLAGHKALVWRLAADGAVEGADLIDLPRASYIHDFTATYRHLVIVLQPWIQDRMVMPFNQSMSWRPEMGTQVLVLDKADLSKRRLYELPAFFCFHMGDAWADAGGAIRFDICLGDDPRFAVQGGMDVLKGTWTPAPAPRMAMITLGADGKAKLEELGQAGEFPRIDGRFAGAVRSKTIHAAAPGKGHPLFQGVAVSDWAKGSTDAYDFGPDHLVEEAVFVARPGGSAEMDGWLVAPSLNTRARATELHVFDAGHVAAGPIATWRAEAALPVSLHGAFVRA